MRNLFDALRNIVDRNQDKRREEEAHINAVLDVFENRMDILLRHAEQSMAYEDALNVNFERLDAELNMLREMVEQCIDNAQDRDALEYLRLAVRLRPQRDLVSQELNAFHAVSDALVTKVNILVGHIDEAREYARNKHWSPAKAEYLDSTLNKLTRYFVMLERVTVERRRTLNDRLVAKMADVIDDRRLDLELATYILQRRRALNAGA
jgi:hypothetical protein